MNKAQQLYSQGKKILKEGGIEAYAFDAACLFTHFCGISRTFLALTEKEPENPADFIDACKKRAEGYPLQYILGKWEFYGIEFAVCPDVLIPRADTETLIDYITERHSCDIKILDMCCGSGCIGLTLKKLMPKASVTLCDISDSALELTRKNAAALGLSVNIQKADLLQGFEKYFEKESFDIIVSNPPYIKTDDLASLSKEVSFEPTLALDGGADGMRFYTALANGWQGALKNGGEMIFEAGFDTVESIKLLFAELGYTDLAVRRDLGGVCRAIGAKKGAYND